MQKTLAIIPARAGSKGIPNKNIVSIASNPLIYYSISRAQQSKYIDKIVVSSDGVDILAIAARYGAEIIRRPKKLAQDNSKMDEAIRHALLYLRAKENYKPDFVVILQPTSPLRRVDTIDRAITTFSGNAEKFDSLISLHRIEPKVGLVEKKYYVPFNKLNMQRQELEPMYKECGTVFVFKPNRILKKQTLYGKRILPFIIDNREESLDINDDHDLNIANYFLKV